LEYGLKMDKVAKGIAGFTGVARRFDVHVQNDKYIYIDDYAHHPEEIRALLNSVREMFPDKKITAVFQPHLFSRTKDFALGFAEVLAMPDELILMDIYPAREKPMPGITSKWLMSKVELDNKKLMTPNEIKEYIALTPPELLVTIGAGDIDRLVQPIKEILQA
jgi:UDP-N-acetylmuramate--alanine ligase